jgi:hypothetical protein
MRKNWSIHYCAGKFPWKMSSFLSAGKFHDEDSIISSTDKFHGKIPSFPQGVKTSTKIKRHHFFSSK